MFKVITHTFIKGEDESNVVTTQMPDFSKFAEYVDFSVKWWRQTLEFETTLEFVHIFCQVSAEFEWEVHLTRLPNGEVVTREFRRQD